MPRWKIWIFFTFVEENMSYNRIQRTGIGAANLPFTGKRIRFTEGGNYPPSSIEYLVLQNQQLSNRNRFLEDAMLRSCYDEEEDPPHIFDMEN